MDKEQIIERGFATCEEMEELSEETLDRFMVDDERIWGYTLDDKHFLPFNNVIQANIWGIVGAHDDGEFDKEQSMEIFKRVDVDKLKQDRKNSDGI